MTGLTDVLVDTSALYALLDQDDRHHDAAGSAWQRLLDAMEGGDVEGLTHSSVLVEATALVQHRLGMRAVRALHDRLLPALQIRWVDGDLHRRSVTALLAANRREVSMVDWTSFELMRERGITYALAFDDDFVDQGFGFWR